MYQALGITGAETRVTVKIFNGEISEITTVVENMKEAGQFIGQTKVDKVTKSIHQVGTIS